MKQKCEREERGESEEKEKKEKKEKKEEREKVPDCSLKLKSYVLVDDYL